jgi:hypothetical protein
LAGNISRPFRRIGFGRIVDRGQIWTFLIVCSISKHVAMIVFQARPSFKSSYIMKANVSSHDEPFLSECRCKRPFFSCMLKLLTWSASIQVCCSIFRKIGLFAAWFMDISVDPGGQHDMGTSHFSVIFSDDPLPMNRIFFVILKRYGF